MNCQNLKFKNSTFKKKSNLKVKTLGNLKLKL
jgi:hypothetical protein